MERQPKRKEDRGWDYPPLEAAMEESGFEEMGAYFLKRHNKVAHYIATRPIMGLYEKTVWRTGAWVPRRWWYQEGLDLVGARVSEEAEAAEAAAEGVGGSEGGEEEP